MQTVNTSIEFNLGDAIAEKLSSSGMTPSGEERLVRPGRSMDGPNDGSDDQEAHYPREWIRPTDRRCE